MYTIELEFQCVQTLAAAERFDVTGIYVLWSPANATRAPTYLGRAPLLHCPRDGTWRWADLDGVVARTRSPADAETAEAALLWTSSAMNRRPARGTGGDDHWRQMDRVITRHPMLCIKIRGRQPFVRCNAPGSVLRPSEELPLWFDSPAALTARACTSRGP
jgi:hypothetical protein